MSGWKALVCLAIVLGFGGAAQAQEDRIRSDAGGIYQSPAWGQGSVTGRPTDFVVIRAWYGSVLYCMTIDQWSKALWIPGYNPVLQTINNSGGQTTLRMDYSRIARVYPEIQGGTVEVFGVANDTDRLY